MEEKPYLKVKKLKKDAVVPSKREEDAGYDLYAVFEEDPIFLFPGDIYLAPLGISTQFPKNYVFYIVERSGSGSKGLSTRAGVVDSGYRGEILTPLNNTSNKLIILSNKDEEEIKNNFSEEIKNYENNFIIYPQSKAIAQGLLLYSPNAQVEEVDELDESERKEKGFGSTNK